ncbi:MAG: hypothetical protein R2867_13280 [Caldilineaceae bacterium]
MARFDNGGGLQHFIVGELSSSPHCADLDNGAGLGIMTTMRRPRSVDHRRQQRHHQPASIMVAAVFLGYRRPYPVCAMRWSIGSVMMPIA